MITLLVQTASDSTRAACMDLTGDIAGTAVDPKSSDWATPTLEKVVTNIAIEEIATVLWEVSSTQPQHSETPELSGSADAPVMVELALLSGTWLRPRHWFQVPALTPGLAGDGPWLFAYASMVVPSVRPLPPVTSLPTSGPEWSQGWWCNIAS